MKWKKLGRILGESNSDYEGNTYAAVPFAQFLDKDLIKIYFSSRDDHNRSVLNFITLNLNKLNIIKDFSTKPLVLPGNLGTFDDSGVMGSCLLEDDDELKLYYIGWNLGKTVPFRNAIGLLTSKDKGLSWEKFSEGPIMDRTYKEPHFVASCCVIKDDGKYKMWYLSCVKWKKIGNKIRHIYHIKYAESDNGYDWERSGRIAIDFKNENEYAISVPRVIIEDSIYKMWYSYRGTHYKIGYAESNDGISWERKDDQHIFIGKDEFWDNQMQCYPFVFNWKDNKYMLYNGNDYGRTGFGIAILEK